jgi:hypothetical protein
MNSNSQPTPKITAAEITDAIDKYLIKAAAEIFANSEDNEDARVWLIAAAGVLETFGNDDRRGEEIADLLLRAMHMQYHHCRCSFAPKTSEQREST